MSIIITKSMTPAQRKEAFDSLFRSVPDEPRGDRVKKVAHWARVEENTVRVWSMRNPSRIITVQGLKLLQHEIQMEEKRQLQIQTQEKLQRDIVAAQEKLQQSIQEMQEKLQRDISEAQENLQRDISEAQENLQRDMLEQEQRNQG